MEEQYIEKIAVKVILVGDGAVGKTSLRRRYMGQGFSVSYIETVGADFASKTIEIDPHQVHLSIWDLASQSIYRGMRSSFYKGASIVIIVYDVSALVSFKSVFFWLEEAMRLTSDSIKALLLVGNKRDLVDLRQVTKEEGELVGEELSEQSKVPVRFIETSALTGENIEEAFYLISKEYVESIGIEFHKAETKTSSNVGDISFIPTTDGSTISSTQTRDLENSDVEIPKEALETLTTKITSLETSQLKLKAELSTLKDELVILEKDKDTMSQETQTNISKEINSLSVKIKELDTLSSKVSELETLSQQVKEIPSLKQGISTLQEQLPDFNVITSKLNALSEKTEELSGIGSSLEKLEPLIKPLIKMTEQIAVLDTQIAAIDEEFDTVKTIIGRLMQVIQKVANSLKEEEAAHQSDHTKPRREWVSSEDLKFLDTLSNDD